MEDPAFDSNAAEKAGPLALHGDESQRNGLHPSGMADGTLAQAALDPVQVAWLEENREAIEAFNAYVEEHGVFSDGWRLF